MVYGLNALDGLLLPWHCVCCGAAAHGPFDLCDGCRAELPALGSACPRCALPCAPSAATAPCARCRARPPPQTRALVPFRYAFPIDRLIVGLKFAGRLERARLLGGLLAAHAAPRLQGAARPAALVAVPLHPDRLRERGYDQAREIARPVAAALGVPLLHDHTRRVRATREQSALDAAARHANLAGAFAVRGPLPAHVALLDDVVTTGATAAALAAALRAAGATRVTLLAVARAV